MIPLSEGLAPEVCAALGATSTPAPTVARRSRSRPHLSSPFTNPHPHIATRPSATVATMGVPFEALLPYGIMLGVRYKPNWPRHDPG